MVRDINQDQINELLELYVLDLLDDDETALVDRQLQEDPAARDRVRELRGIASMMALELDPVAPPPALKSRILDQARAEGLPAPPVDLDARREQRSLETKSALLPWAVAAVLALALASSLLWAVSLRGQISGQPTIDRFAVRGVDDATGAIGELVVINGEDTAVLFLTALDQPGSGEVYQVWLIENEQPQSAGTFLPDAQGFASVVIEENVESYQLLAITIEPEGGSTLPTTSPIIVSELGTALGPIRSFRAVSRTTGNHS